MIPGINATHDPNTKSWVESANEPDSDFPIQNLPFGVFRRTNDIDRPSVGVAIGNQILDLASASQALSLTCPADPEPSLNRIMALHPDELSAMRQAIHASLCAGSPNRLAVELALVPMSSAELLLPAKIGGYTDFYASIHHATNVGRLFRPENPLLPNYKYVPIAYHGRSSSIVVSGTPVIRPSGQQRSGESDPAYAPSRRLDFELEAGLYIGQGNRQGTHIPITEAARHIFGFNLVNDWSARDVQAWEYQPLGPFLGKNFATTVSPWIVTQEALAPFRAPQSPRPEGDPRPLPYLFSEEDQQHGAFNIELEVFIASEKMRQQGTAPHRLTRVNFNTMYWTPAQMVTHHASNGCNLQAGDLLASGTVSGPAPGSLGSLLEITKGGREPFQLPGGETRTFLEDGDEVIFRGSSSAPGFRRIGFGECRGVILPAFV